MICAWTDALWNGSAFLTLLPGSTGEFFSKPLIIGSVTLPYFELVNIGEAILILLFFLYITYRIRGKAVAVPVAVTTVRCLPTTAVKVAEQDAQLSGARTEMLGVPECPQCSDIPAASGSCTETSASGTR